MKKPIQLLFSGVFFLGTIIANAQISTRTGGGSNVLANVPTTNTNVGIGTTSPTAKLEVVGDVKAKQGFFTNSLPNGSVFSSWQDRNDKCLGLSVGSLLGAGSGYLNTRMFHFYDFPQSNLDAKSSLYFSIEDRLDMRRFRVTAETGGTTEMSVWNRNQEVLMRVYENGADNVYMDLPKTNSRIVIGGYGDYLPEHKFVVRGSSKIEGNILTDSNIGIGTSSFVDGADNYRLSVNGAIRASRVKVYTTWADFVFEKDYKLSNLDEVEKYIKDNGHLKDIPSAKEVEEKGIELGEMNKLLLQKVEELTLYLITLNKELQEVKSQIK